MQHFDGDRPSDVRIVTSIHDPQVAASDLGLEFVARLKAIIIARQDYILDRIQADAGKSRTDALTAEIFGTLDHLDYLEKNAVNILADRKVPTPFARIPANATQPHGNAPLRRFGPV